MDTSKSANPSKRSLTSLKKGEEGIIESIETSPEVCLKLMEMGITPGESVQFIREAPFGDPLEIEIMHFRLAIRKSEADKIFLKQL